jgi:hypothetical protein
MALLTTKTDLGLICWDKCFGYKDRVAIHCLKAALKNPKITGINTAV